MNSIDRHIKLIRDCIEFQFRKLPRGDSWKRQYKEDLFQDLCIALMEYDEGKFRSAEEGNHLNALITKMIINNVWSKTSPFYRKYLLFNEITMETENERDGEGNDGEEDD